MLLFVIIILAATLILPPGLIFVSIVWTHRPDLSLLDILREAIKEIKEFKNTRAGKSKPGRKGEIQHEQHYHL